MTDIVICYTGRSCITGKTLLNKLKGDARFSRVRKIKGDGRINNTDVFLRWGNGSSYNPPDCIEINNLDAVVNASSKKRMMRLLREAEIPTPPFAFITNSTGEELLKYRNDDGNFFIRNNDGVVRYDSTYTDNDAYVMEPIDKTREYRVHVFDGEVIAIYEKIPNEDSDGIIRKDDNSKFSRCNPENTRCNERAQKICIDAVNALGLTFGGVDIIRQRKIKGYKRRFFVTEVNSSPALNSNMVEKYVDKFAEYIETFREDDDVSEDNESFVA